MNFNIGHIVRLIIAVILLTVQYSFGQRVRVPVDVQFKVLPKILSLNKNFNFDGEDSFNIGILHSTSQRNSKQVYEGFEKLFNSNKINIKQRSVKFHSVEMNSLSHLRDYLKKMNIIVLYITPLRGTDISEISKICKEEEVLTIAGVEEYLENNVSAGLSLVDNKVKIIINQKSAKSEGANFSSRLLKIAKVID